ncbi:MAG: Quinolinate phosphoribosyl transferase [Solirubrobacterales bacterium]|nr:Quinolinate phosphoribosyl transferase [Solirubrobacterales bacterium]
MPATSPAPARLPAEIFDLPVERLRSGYLSDAYFTNTKALLEAEGRHPHVLMQVFQKHESFLGGIDEAIAILRLGSGRRTPDGGWDDGWGRLRVRALAEGDPISPWEPVLTVEGPYTDFAHLETVYLGCLGRRSLIMRNVKAVRAAARGKDILFFGARHDHWRVQTGDGWAAHVAGAIGVSTDAQASWWGGRGVGTVPHGLIAAYDGDTVAAARAFAAHFSEHLNVTVLVDFENDSVGTALKVADALGPRLWGVRLDTSERLVDRALQDAPGPEADRRGVTPELARAVRAALDDAGHGRVRIVASGGFDVAKIERFEAQDAPVDVYGVGSALVKGGNDFTADIVRVDGRPRAKAGREERPSERLRLEA